MAPLLPTFTEDHVVSHIRFMLSEMKLERKIGGLEDNVKGLQDNVERLQIDIEGLRHDNKGLRFETWAVRFILGGVASREWVDHGILGRRSGSAWSMEHLFLEPVDETASKIAPKNVFHQPAHWATIEQAHEETARRPDTIKAQYCINTDSRNPVEQKDIIQSYTVEKLQEVFSL
ncbi:MAG: hypothetical protein Q9184_002403, partial [Pyrenodesmia sp. 2 TL-2023]